MNPNKKLPVFELVIDEESGIDSIVITDEPLCGVNFIAFQTKEDEC